MYRHIVLFRVHDEVSDERVSQALGELRALASLPGIESWTVELSLDTRKGRVIVEDATFRSADAFAAFRAQPLHLRAGAEMALISDWWNGDFITAPPALPVEPEEP